MVLSCLHLWNSLPSASHGNSAQLWSTVSCINGRVWNKQREDRQVPNLQHILSCPDNLDGGKGSL